MLPRLKERLDERGVALPFVAIMLTLLIGMTALAVDLGWLYLNGSRVQRGADAAALAAVVHLPHNTAGVNANTVDGANANGWNVGTLNGSVIPGGGPERASWRPLSENRLEVTLTADIPTFFLRIFGMENVTITRRATAEYIKPVPMGSPSSCFGVGAYAANLSGAQSLSSQGLSNCNDWTMNFWAAINGPRTAKEHGDPYAVECMTSSCSTANDDYRPSGYYYGIEVPANKTQIQVKIFDAGLYPRTNGQTETGDLQNLKDSNNGSFNTTYRVLAPDDTPLDPTDNSNLICSETHGTNQSSPNTKNLWRTVCTIPNPTAGIYVLNVRTSGSGGGNNSYSIGVSSSGGNASEHARVYAINDMSIYTNSISGTATVYLAEVEEIHAGKTLLLGFYDPGENLSGNAWVTVRRPRSNSGLGPIPNCDWTSTHDDGTPGPSGSGQCSIQSTIGGNPRFNSHWLNSRINIPSGYTCPTYNGGPNCFWTMNLDMGTSQDRTTWAARVIGNPVRLVPNDTSTTP